MNRLIPAMVALAAVLFVAGGLSLFLSSPIKGLGQAPIVWWRGSMGLLGFSISLALWRMSETRAVRQ